MPSYGVNNDYIKARNRELILQLICCSAIPLSRTDLVVQTGLSKMTVSNIITELIEAGYVTETASVENTGVGRNPVLLDLADNAPLLLGIYISRCSISAVVADLHLQSLYQHHSPLEAETAGTLITKLRVELLRARDAFPTRRILGIGVASIGPLDCDGGLLLSPPDFFGIHQVPLVACIEKDFSCSVVLNNDMNAAALAEHLYGAGRNDSNFIYVGITNGIGAGIISRGSLYQNNSGFVGELGHTSIAHNGRKCVCGRRGCLETYANMPVILNALSVAMGREITKFDLNQAWADPAGRNILMDAVEKLSVGLTNMVNLLDPSCIFLGHEAAYFPPECIQLIGQQINAQNLARDYRQIPVCISSFGEYAPLFGSCALVSARLFQGKIDLFQLPE